MCVVFFNYFVLPNALVLESIGIVPIGCKLCSLLTNDITLNLREICTERQNLSNMKLYAFPLHIKHWAAGILILHRETKELRFTQDFWANNRVENSSNTSTPSWATTESHDVFVISESDSHVLQCIWAGCPSISPSLWPKWWDPTSPRAGSHEVRPTGRPPCGDSHWYRMPASWLVGLRLAPRNYKPQRRWGIHDRTTSILRCNRIVLREVQLQQKSTFSEETCPKAPSCLEWQPR